MISRENRKREFEERVIAYEEKIPHELGRQFDRIPDGKEDYYPLMPKEDRVFWIDVFKNYTNYSLNEKPTRPTFLCDKVSETNVWKAFLYSQFPDLDLCLYLKRGDSPIPVFVILNQGHIISLHSDQFNKSGMRGNLDSIDYAISQGGDFFKTWLKHFKDSLHTKKLDDRTYMKIMEVFSKIISQSREADDLHYATDLYQTDINMIRHFNHLGSRPVFNQNIQIFIQGKTGNCEYSMAELYLDNELPKIILFFIYDLSNQKMDYDYLEDKYFKPMGIRIKNNEVE